MPNLITIVECFAEGNAVVSIVQHLIPESQTPESLITATEEMSVQDALERMIEHDFSQLPVVDRDFKLKGLVTSDSILRAVSYFRTTLDKIKVSHATFNTRTCRPDDELSELLNGLRDASAIPVVDKTGKLIAIITNFDAAEYYRQRAEDIMLAEDIETTLRDYIEIAYRSGEGRIDNDSLQRAIEDITPSGKELKKKFKQALCSYLGQSGQIPPQPDHKLIDEVFKQSHLHQPIEIRLFEELTLFEYVQLFKKVWSKYEVAFNYLELEAIDRVLNEVRQTRNAIAHFREITANQRKQLRFCAGLLDRHRPKFEELVSQDEPVVTIIDNAQLSSEISVGSYETMEVNGGEFIPIDEELGSNESRYAPFAIWLQGQGREGQEKISLTFEQIEKIIDDKLPPSARYHRNWWANDSVGHTQSQQWLDVGWRVSSVNIGEERVVFSLMGDRQNAYVTFFNDLQYKLHRANDLKVKPATNLQGRAWLGVEITSAEFSKSVWLVFSFARKSRFRIERYIDTGDKERNKKIFDALYNYKAEIELKLGEDLSWERLDSRRASRIALYYEGISITSPHEELTKLQDWTVKKLSQFYRTLAPYLIRDDISTV